MEHPFFWTFAVIPKKMPFHVEHFPMSNFDSQAKLKVQEILACGVAQLEFAALEQIVPALVQLTEILFAWSKRTNLTGHSTPEKIASRLILDSLALGTVLPEFDFLADLGSGAGFPGIPLAILFPRRKIILIEARERRVHFQRHVIRELGLKNVSSLCGRAEELSPQPCDLVIAQAMADFVQVVAWMKPWCKVEGYFAVPCSMEQAEILETTALSDVKQIELRTYRVPIVEIERKVWIAKRER